MSEIIKINENTYKFDDIEISREKHKGKMVWAADGFLTPGQFKEFEDFVSKEDVNGLMDAWNGLGRKNSRTIKK